VTPELNAVYDELLERAARLERARALRELFFERAGRVDPDHPTAAERDRAAWEDAIVAGGLAGELGAELDDPAERELARALAGAQRGLFVFESEASQVIASDLWSGAKFLIVRRDDVGRELARLGSDAGAPLCQARIAATREGAAVLPGAIFHPTDARSAVARTLAVARERGLATDAVLDALLRMEHAWRTLSRVKVGYAYRPEALPR
jgi:hypothetical protein